MHLLHVDCTNYIVRSSYKYTIAVSRKKSFASTEIQTLDLLNHVHMPQLTFLTYRQDADNLAIDHAKNAARKKKDLEASSS